MAVTWTWYTARGGALGSNRICSPMRPLPGIQSSAGASANTCIGHSCGRAWYWAGLFEPPTPAETVTYTLSFRRGEVIDSWYGGYNSKLGSVEVALIPLPAGEGIDEANGADAAKFATEHARTSPQHEPPERGTLREHLPCRR